ncbi:MAG: polysaccharide deacetylase family protein [Bacteroidia bacterium]|nr:polysaccharide deacetylase family protein [Bacteroidia bacterium]MDW8089320.1 polysaccharide deacetylase family protein [Bacteroidia bacterium]
MRRLPRFFQRLVGAYVPTRPQSRLFYLTIDDGPQGSTTEQILDLLALYQAKATFFWLWSRYEARHTPALAARLLAEGHTIGLHGDSHISPWRHPFSLKAKLHQAKLLWTNAGIPLAPLYRPPYGHLTGLERWQGWRLVLWDWLMPDYLYHTTWADTLLLRLRAGDIVVLHERRWGLAEWRKFLSAAYASGWRAMALPVEEGPQLYGYSLSPALDRLCVE